MTMKFGFAIETSANLASQSAMVREIGMSLSKKFEDQYYGNSVKEIVIGVILSNENDRKFLRKKKPKYISGEKTLREAGITFVVEDVLSFSVVLPLDSIHGMKNKDDMKGILCTAISHCSKEIADMEILEFDSSRFFGDTKKFLLSHE